MTARRRSRLPVTSVLLLLGCVGTFEPSEEWEAFVPPPSYHAWHAQVETCVAGRRPFEDVVWRKIHSRAFTCVGFPDKWGCFISPRTIYIVVWLMDDERLVKTELVHYVRQDVAHDSLHARCARRSPCPAATSAG